MADVRGAILFPRFVLGAESQPRIESEAAGGSHVCVCMWSSCEKQPTQG